MRKEELLKKIKNKEISFEEIEKEFLEDKEIATELLKQEKDLYGLFSENIRNDKQIALLVFISGNSNIFEFEKKADENIIHIGSKLQEDTNFLLSLVRERVLSVENLDMASLKIRNNKEVINKLVKYSQDVITKIGDDLLNDKEFMQELIKENIGLLKNNKVKRFLSDKEFCLELLQNDSSNVLMFNECFPKFLRNDKDFILDILELEKGKIFYNVISDRLKEDREIILKLANLESVPYLGIVPDKLMMDTDFVSEILGIYEQKNLLLKQHSLRRNSRESLIKLLLNKEYSNLFVTLYKSDDFNDLRTIMVNLKEKEEDVVHNLYKSYLSIKEKELMEKSVTDSQIKNKKLKF